MRVLVVGAGGREHALVDALVADPDVTAVIAAPGNAGIAEVADTAALDVSDPDAVGDLAAAQRCDLVVIGPEVPLVLGAADAVRSRDIACFGPSAQAARLEGSKTFAKAIMAAAGVPTAMAHVCDEMDEVMAALDAFGPPYVVKDDGLAAGKGVVVTHDRDVALEHAARCGRVLVEEFLDGPEVSLFCLTDGETVVALQPAQDFKRLGDGDSGPNTGGMGAYSPLPWAPSGLTQDVVERVVQPSVDELRRLGTPFVGVVYAGLALTSRGLRVVEFNARFGDPETQVVLARLRTPLGGLLHAAATGTLADHEPLRWDSGAAVTVVLAAPGYPAAARTGGVLGGLNAAARVPNVRLHHAGTRQDEQGQTVAAGGRVLCLTATGADLEAARAAAYEAADLVELDGGQLRRDIAKAAAVGEVRLPADYVPPVPGSSATGSPEMGSPAAGLALEGSQE